MTYTLYKHFVDEKKKSTPKASGSSDMQMSSRDHGNGKRWRKAVAEVTWQKLLNFRQKWRTTFWCDPQVDNLLKRIILLFYFLNK